MTLAREANRALGTKIASAAIGYGFAMALARSVPGEVFGTVALILNAALLAGIVAAGGRPMLLLREVPACLARHQHLRLASLVSHAALKTVLWALPAGVALLAAALAAQSAGYLGAYPPAALAVGAVLVPLASSADLLSHLARAFGMMRLALVPRDVAWRGAAALMVAWLARAGSAPGPAGVLAMMAGILALALLAQAAILVARQMLPRRAAPPTRADRREWSRAARHYWVSSVSNVFLAYADVVAVGLALGPALAGQYFAANRLAQALALFQTGTNLALAPRLAGRFAAADVTRALGDLDAATLRAFWQTLGAAALLAVAAPLALSLFGHQFTAAAPALRILALAALANAAFGPGDIALNMAGRESVAARVSVVSMLLSLAFLTAGAAAGSPAAVAGAVLAATVARKALFWAAALWHLGMTTDAASALTRRRAPAMALAE